MTIALPDHQGTSIEVRVIEKQLLAPDSLCLVLSTLSPTFSRYRTPERKPNNSHLAD